MVIPFRPGDDGFVIRRILNFANEMLHRPGRVLWLCVGMTILGLFIDGSALRLWSLHREHAILLDKIEQAKTRLTRLQFKIQKAQQPEFIERAARDQFDLVREGDLIFFFSEAKSGSKKKE